MLLKRQAESIADLERAPPPGKEREFEFSDADFRNLVQLARAHTGIALTDSKRNLVYSRLSRRLRVLGLSSFREYRDYLQSPDGEPEIEGFINSISTNLTKLFRESHHFDHFGSQVVAKFAREAKARSGGRFRVWSAGCSTGEEPYSIAIILRREIAEVARHDVRILASDIDTDVLAKGRVGEYPASALDDVPPSYRELLRPMRGSSNSKTITMDDDLRDLIRFGRVNLMEPWPFNGLFDAIFCRNVMIYFDGPTKEKLVDRFTQQIKPGGWLYIGHSESLHGAHPNIELVGRTIYRRRA